VLAPLIVGFIGLIGSIVFQRYYVKEPTVPFQILANRTSAAGYAMTFIHGVVTIAAFYYLPVVSRRGTPLGQEALGTRL
jgi:hypothetical protein